MGNGKKKEWEGGPKPECPAVIEFKATLLEAVLILGANPGKVGTIRNDDSRHTAGLAVDIMLDSRDVLEKAVGDQIVQAVVNVHARMKWSDLIYTDWIGGAPYFFHIPGMPPYGGKNGMLKKNTTTKALGEQHINHIHIEWWDQNPKEWPAFANTTGFKTPLITELTKTPQWLVDYMKTI
jgi:hypothetical protein